MLDVLKEQLRVDKTTDLIMESATDDSIRDMFLDDQEMIVLGAENDPEINSLVAKIPPYKEHDAEIEKEIEAIAESALLEI